MALTAVGTITLIARTVWGNKRVVIADVVLGDDTWPSGGLALTPSQLKLDGVDLVLITGKKLDYYYDYSNEKIDAYLPPTVTGADKAREAANGATPDETVRLIAIGYGG